MCIFLNKPPLCRIESVFNFQAFLEGKAVIGWSSKAIKEPAVCIRGFCKNRNFQLSVQLQMIARKIYHHCNKVDCFLVLVGMLIS